jgi:hypothetical protein
MTKGKAFDPADDFMTPDQHREYFALAHAIQAGTKMEARVNRHYVRPEMAVDIRIGLNVQMAEYSGLVLLLVRKGLVTKEEMAEAILAGLRNELARLEALHPNTEFV